MNSFRDTKTPECVCPYCLKKLNGAANFKGQTPKPGDISICIYCGYTLVFTTSLTLRKPKLNELSMEDMEAANAMRSLLRRRR